MEIMQEKERPVKATLIADDYAVKDITFKDGSTAKKLALHGKIKELENKEVEITNTDTGSLWVYDESTADNIKVGNKSGTATFFKIFKIKKETDLKRTYPLTLQPSKGDATKKFYVIDTNA